MTSSSSVNTSTIDTRKLKGSERPEVKKSDISAISTCRASEKALDDTWCSILWPVWPPRPCYRLLPSHVSRCSSICSLSWLRFGRFQDHLYLASRKACCLKQQNECRNKPCHMLSINVNHLWTYLLHSASLFVHGSTLGYDSIPVPVFLLSLPIPFPTVLRYVLPQFFTNVSSPLPFCHYFPLYFCWFFSFSLFSSPISSLFCLQCALPICLPTFLSTFPFLFPFLVVLVSAKFSCFTGKLKVVLSVCMGCWCSC